MLYDLNMYIYYIMVKLLYSKNSTMTTSEDLYMCVLWLERLSSW